MAGRVVAQKNFVPTSTVEFEVNGERYRVYRFEDRLNLKDSMNFVALRTGEEMLTDVEARELATNKTSVAAFKENVLKKRGEWTFVLNEENESELYNSFLDRNPITNKLEVHSFMSPGSTTQVLVAKVTDSKSVHTVDALADMFGILRQAA